jgi:hypothetical protein
MSIHSEATWQSSLLRPQRRHQSVLKGVTCVRAEEDGHSPSPAEQEGGTCGGGAATSTGGTQSCRPPRRSASKPRLRTSWSPCAIASIRTSSSSSKSTLPVRGRCSTRCGGAGAERDCAAEFNVFVARTSSLANRCQRDTERPGWGPSPTREDLPVPLCDIADLRSPSPHRHCSLPQRRVCTLPTFKPVTTVVPGRGRRRKRKGGRKHSTRL